MGSCQVLPLQPRVDLEAMAMKALYIPQSFSITGVSPSLVGILPLCRDAFGVFYSPIRLDVEMKVYSTFHRSPELKICHQMQFSDISKIPLFFWRREYLLLCRGYSQCILSPDDRTLINSEKIYRTYFLLYFYLYVILFPPSG